MTQISRTVFVSRRNLYSCMYVLRYTEAKSLHLGLTCLKTLPPACGFAMIGCRLSRERILLTFASLAESSSSIFSPSTWNKYIKTCKLFITGDMAAQITSWRVTHSCTPGSAWLTCCVVKIHRISYVMLACKYHILESDKLLHSWQCLAHILCSADTQDIICDVGM